MLIPAPLRMPQVHVKQTLHREVCPALAVDLWERVDNAGRCCPARGETARHRADEG
jgi:hypothetical protein